MADTERLVIDHVGHRGDGVTAVCGESVYVPYTLGGETVEVAPVPGHHPDRRRLVTVDSASPERIAPFCPHFGVCGGCALQHLDAGAQLRWKERELLETLQRLGDLVPTQVMPAVAGPVWGYRRKARLGARYVNARQRSLVGFRERSTTFVAALDSCPVR